MVIEDSRAEAERIVYDMDFIPGLILHENSKYWIGIVKVEGDDIAVLEGENLKNLNYYKYSKEELKERLCYESFYGTFVDFHSIDVDYVKNWLKEKIKSTYKGNRKLLIGR